MSNVTQTNGTTSKSCWKSVKSSRMARETDNPIEKILIGMKLTPNPEKEMIRLSIGDPTTFGNLPLCDVIQEAVVESTRSQKRNGYAPSVGYEDARSAVAARHSLPSELLTSKDVVLTSGCLSALDLAISVFADPGDNILLPRPGFPLYMTLAGSLDIRVKYYNLIPEESWQIDLDHLESLIDSRTACIIVNNPSNPCGSVYSKEHIRQILEVANRNNIPIIADEVYTDFIFPGCEYVSMASQSTNVPILAVGGITKTYLVPGWRLGWIIIHDRNDAFKQEVRPGLVNLSQRILGPNTLVQGALSTILTKTPQEFIRSTVEVVQRNAELCFQAMMKTRGLNPIMPSGSMYMMIGIDMKYFPTFKSDLDFTASLVSEQSVFCLPGKCFQYPNYFRVVLTVPEEKLAEACQRIAEFCRRHYVPIDRIVEKNGVMMNGHSNHDVMNGHCNHGVMNGHSNHGVMNGHSNHGVMNGHCNHGVMNGHCNHGV